MQDPPCSWRVLQDGSETVFPSFAAVLGAVRAGRVTGDSRAKKEGDEAWKRVAEVPELAAELMAADPWAVWDAMEEEDPEDPPTDPGSAPEAVPALPEGALKEAASDDLPIAELPMEAVRSLPVPTTRRGRRVIDGNPTPRPQPSRAGAPVPLSGAKPEVARPSGTRSPAPSGDAPVRQAAASVEPEPVSSSNVIAFPSPGGLDTVGPHALAPLHSEALFELPALKAPQPVEPRTGPRWGLLVLVGLVAFGLVGVVHGWVRHVATQSFAPRPPAGAVVAAVSPEAAPSTEVGGPEAPDEASATDPDIDELSALDLRLRGRMRSEIGTIRGEGDLETALFVDLSRMSLTELKVDAIVTAWGGKMQDVPKSAEIQIGLRSTPGELDRELAAVGLIIGRYVQSYELEVARFEVLLDTGEAGIRRWPIDPAQARNYYIRRTDLPSFLRNMRKSGGR